MIHISFIDDFLKSGFLFLGLTIFQPVTSISCSDTASPLNRIMRANSRLSINPFPSWNFSDKTCDSCLTGHIGEVLHCQTPWKLPEYPPLDSGLAPWASSSWGTQGSLLSQFHPCQLYWSSPKVMYTSINITGILPASIKSSLFCNYFYSTFTS